MEFDLPDATTTLSDINERRRFGTRVVRHTIDIRDYLGTPGYALLFVAANTHLTQREIEERLEAQAEETPGTRRPKGWIQRRRWLFQKPGTDNTKLPQPNRDGMEAPALRIMAQHPTMSVRDLTQQLKRSGIVRSREWVRKHRCTALQPPV